ncbi:MAG: TonB-dependent receptor plug domain-containing protein [Bacteroidales bacterium]|nr:TonB-dependent receptor plug domain-containing protein [Bacteroidales bacterium]
MQKQLFISLAFVLLHTGVFSQGIRDSVFHIRQVQVDGDHTSKNEPAGIKSSRVDSLVLSEKINLSLSELLSENTSVFIKNHGRGALATASFRGTSASHTQVTWNGININAPMTGMTDFSLIPVYIIDEVNLKHGTGSVSEMNGGLGGSVNLENKANWNKKFDARYMQALGSFHTFDEFFQMGGGNKKVQLKTRLYHNYSRNNYPFVNRGIAGINPLTGKIENPLDTNEHADYKKYGLLQEIYYRPNTRNVMALRYWGQQADRAIPRATSYEGPNHSNLNQQDNRDHKAVLSWKRYGEVSNLKLTSGFSSKHLNYQMMNHVSGLGLIPVVHSLSSQNSLLNHLTYTYQPDKQFSLKGRLDINLHDVASRDTVIRTGYETQRSEVSAMVDFQRSFYDRINLNLILRQDIIDGRFIPVIPFAGFDIRPFMKQQFFIKGNIARNYHMPSLNDLYWQPGGNPDLLPEEGVSAELGAEYSMKNRHTELKTELTIFRSNINHWILWIPSYKGYWEPRNVTNVLSKGIEFSTLLNGKVGAIKYRLSGTYALTRSINYGDPKIWGDASYGKQLVYVPVHSANFFIHLARKGYSITWQHNSFSERFTTSSNDVTRRDWLYPYFMNDLVLGKDFAFDGFRVSAQLKVYNLFNETYHSVLYRPMPGRNYMVVLLFRL